jgi:hypothetical protein
MKANTVYISPSFRVLSLLRSVTDRVKRFGSIAKRIFPFSWYFKILFENSANCVLFSYIFTEIRLLWWVIVGSLHCVDVGSAANIPGLHATSSFRIGASGTTDCLAFCCL